MQLARTNGNVSSTARDLSISVSLLQKWMMAERENGQAALPGHSQQLLSADQQEICRLHKEVEILRQEREILKKATAYLGQNGTCTRACPLFRQRDHTLRFRFVEKHQSHYRLDIMCRMLEVSVSGYHSWRRRPISNHQQQGALLQQRIHDVYHRKARYGVLRIHAELQAEGLLISRKRIARPMRADGLRANAKHRSVRTTHRNHNDPVCPNLLGRQFNVQQPNQAWAADLTYIPAKGGWLYLAVTLELFSRTGVGIRWMPKWRFNAVGHCRVDCITATKGAGRRPLLRSFASHLRSFAQEINTPVTSFKLHCFKFKRGAV